MSWNRFFLTIFLFISFISKNLVQKNYWSAPSKPPYSAVSKSWVKSVSAATSSSVCYPSQPLIPAPRPPQEARSRCSHNCSVFETNDSTYLLSNTLYIQAQCIWHLRHLQFCIKSHESTIGRLKLKLCVHLPSSVDLSW